MHVSPTSGKTFISNLQTTLFSFCIFSQLVPVPGAQSSGARGPSPLAKPPVTADQGSSRPTEPKRLSDSGPSLSKQHSGSSTSVDKVGKVLILGYHLFLSYAVSSPSS